MNTRLQVEHPVTEEITGLDLVEWQVRVARGERLPKLQDELQIHGHSIEVRVYAEDTLNGFTPDIGTLHRYRRPNTGLARVDDAFEEGMDVPIFYDPMIAKLVVWAETREAAMDKMVQAIDAYEISGVKTTLDFGKFVMKHPAFRSGDFDTNFIKHCFEDPPALSAAVSSSYTSHIARGSSKQCLMKLVSKSAERKAGCFITNFPKSRVVFTPEISYASMACTILSIAASRVSAHTTNLAIIGS